jgi:hypothetical protein
VWTSLPPYYGTREEPGTLTQGAALFSLVPLVWESNAKLQGGWCKPNYQHSGDLEPTQGGAGTREEPGTLTQGAALFFLVPLIWESNPKLQGGWCKPNHQRSGDLEPSQGGAGTRLCLSYQ